MKKFGFIALFLFSSLALHAIATPPSLNNNLSLQDNDADKLETSVKQFDRILEKSDLGLDDNGDRFQTKEDRELVNKIRDVLKGGWFSKNFDQIVIVVYHGNVMLRGKVDSQTDINTIDDRLKKVEGIRNVVSDISVKKESK